MIPPMPRRPMRMPPPIIPRQQHIDRRQQIHITTGTGLDDRQPRRGMRHEHVQQPVPRTMLPQEHLTLPGDIPRRRPRTRRQLHRHRMKNTTHTPRSCHLPHTAPKPPGTMIG